MELEETTTLTGSIGTPVANLASLEMLLAAQGFDVEAAKARMPRGIPEALQARFINESGVHDVLNAMLRDLWASWGS
jgi:hypothetical protein